MSTLVLAEIFDGHLAKSTSSVLKASEAFNAPVTVLVLGHGCFEAARQAAALKPVTKVYHVDDPGLADGPAEPIAALLVDLMAHFDVLLAAASTHGKNILPRVAAMLDISPLNDVIEIVSSNTFMRPIYAGNAVECIRSEQEKQMLTVRPTVFPLAEPQDAVEIEELTFQPACLGVVSHGIQTTRSERPALTEASIVVAGGRGLKSQENFQVLEALADCLGAAMGASRAAVDAGFVPNDWQIGQTGKVVAPELYFAIGISGAIQHVAGIKDSKVIVAINKDPDAPIFEVADYGLVGDLFELVPALTEKIRALRS